MKKRIKRKEGMKRRKETNDDKDKNKEEKRKE